MIGSSGGGGGADPAGSGPVYLVDGVRTPIGRYGGALATVRTDDLGAVPIRALMARHADLDWQRLDEVVYGNVNQAGEDNRNVARMCALLAGLPTAVAGVTVNRLCGSGMDAVASAARTIALGEAELMIAGGVESMSRSPLVMPKPDAAWSRRAEVHDSTIGWRFVNPLMHELHGTDSMGETAENVADEHGVSREDQDRFALASQRRAVAAIEAGRLAGEICPVEVPGRRRGVPPSVVDTDEHPRPDTTLDALAALRPAFREGGTVTAGNSAGVNDGAAALLLASASMVERLGLTPLARIGGAATAGVDPRVMGIGPVPAVEKLLARTGRRIGDYDVVELNEAFAAQGIAVLRALGLEADAGHVNADGGAIALGHPLGMSGARLVLTAARRLRAAGGRRALCTMCIGVGQGIALEIESP